MVERHWVSVPEEEGPGQEDSRVVGEGLPAPLWGLGTYSLQCQIRAGFKAGEAPFSGAPPSKVRRGRRRQEEEED